MKNVKTSLGVSPSAGLRIRDLLKRCEAVLSVMHGGSPGLDFLTRDDAILESDLILDEFGQYVLVTPIPEDPQAVVAVGRRGSRRDSLGPLDRTDARDAERADEVAALLAASSTMLTNVSDALSSEASPQQGISKLERATGADTRPFRRFIYEKQADFTANAGDQDIRFESEVVRAAVALPEDMDAEVVPFRNKIHDIVFRARVDTCKGEGAPRGLISGGVKRFRLAAIARWQAVVLEGARALGLQLRMAVRETMSTCTLKPGIVDVHRVDNWLELLEAVHAYLGDILERVRQARNAELELTAEAPEDVSKAA